MGLRSNDANLLSNPYLRIQYQRLDANQDKDEANCCSTWFIGRRI